MHPLFEHRMVLGGFRTRVLELEGEGPTLLFFHGFADSADTWRHALAELGRHDRRAVAVDMPGFGTASDLRAGKVLPQLDRFAHALAAHYAPDGGLVAVGNSLGGTVALRLAERADLPLEGVVPVAPAGLEMARWLALIEREPLLRAVLATPVPGWVVRAVVAEVYRRLAFARPRAIDAKVVGSFCSHFPDRARASGYIATAHRLLPELRDPFRLEEVSCPILMVWGDRDVLVFPTGADRVLDTVPDARLELIDDCGHCPQIEAPERFASLLLDFPASLPRAA
jgi:pimeloyl-ACP methyl ester carboxylesterase